MGIEINFKSFSVIGDSKKDSIKSQTDNAGTTYLEQLSKYKEAAILKMRKTEDERLKEVETKLEEKKEFLEKMFRLYALDMAELYDMLTYCNKNNYGDYKKLIIKEIAKRDEIDMKRIREQLFKKNN